MSSNTDSFVNSPLVNTIARYLAQFQQKHFFNKENSYLIKHTFLFVIGLLVVLYALIRVQIILYWILKTFFHWIFSLFSIIFWLPLKTIRFLTPSSIDYDILFPLFWLCSIVSFYITKFSHEKISHWYETKIQPRYILFDWNNQIQREQGKRYLFLATFLAILLIQCIFILGPIALSIRNQHQQIQSSSSTPPIVVKQPLPKSADKGFVKTIGKNLYRRFIDAFTDDENEVNLQSTTSANDEQLENRLKTMPNSIKDTLNSKLQEQTSTDERPKHKSSIFQRWIVHYLKAPFQKWESPAKNATQQSQSIGNNTEEENDQNDEYIFSSSSHVDTDDEEDEEDSSESEDEDDEEEEEHFSVTDRIKQHLAKPIETIKSLGKRASDSLRSKMPSSIIEDDEEEEESSSIKTMKNLAEIAAADLLNKISSMDTKDSDEESDDEEEEEQSSLTDRMKQGLNKPVENLGEIVRNKLSSSTSQDDDDSGNESDDEEEEKSPSMTEQIKENLRKPIETLKTLGENAAANVRSKLSSSSDKEEDEDSDEEEDQSLIDRAKRTAEKIVAPVFDKVDDLRSKVSTSDTDSGIDSSDDEEESRIEQLKHKASDLADSAQQFGSKVLEKSSEFVKEKSEQVKETLSDMKENLIDPLEETIEDKASNLATQVKEALSDRIPDEDLSTTLGKMASDAKDAILDRVKLKAKKPKTFSGKAKETLQSFGETLLDTKDKLKKKVSQLGKKKKKSSHVLEQVHGKVNKLFHHHESTLFDKVKSKLKKKDKKKSHQTFGQKLNGWLDEAWNVWHQTKIDLENLYHSSTRHARLLPRYNVSSIYTAYTDVSCHDYTKKINRYRRTKRTHQRFLDSYRRQAPFPVYLSILKSNGPMCYRHYPNSSCGILFQVPVRNFKRQLYRLVRFWAIIGVLVGLLATIYKAFTQRQQQQHSHQQGSSFQDHRRSDRFSNAEKQSSPLASTKKTDLPSTSAKNSNNNNNNNNNKRSPSSSTTNNSPLNEEIEKQLRFWLEREQNDGYQNVSEACRVALNNAFKQCEQPKERLNVETLQFANAKICNVSQGNNNNNNNASIQPSLSNEKITINALLEIDRLILNIVNTFKNQHYSLETPKLTGQLHIVLVVNSQQYSIEADIQQLRIEHVNVIDPNNTLSPDDKRSVAKLLEETISRAVVHCSFRLSDNKETLEQETTAFTPYSDSNKTHLASSLQPISRSRQPTPTPIKNPPLEVPTVLIDDGSHHKYSPKEKSSEKECKRLLVRIIKAVNLHNVEHPFCLLELNHPKQTHATNIAENGLNPFWDERFLFECDEKSNQIRLQIIDRKKTSSNAYSESVYADISIPFSYVTSTVYKRDIQTSPHFPDSIIRIEFSTLSEAEALAANNGYDVESITDSQTWTYTEREAHKIEHDYPHRYQHSPTNDFISSSYESSTMPKNYGLTSGSYDHDNHGDYASTLPRPIALHSTINTLPVSSSLNSHDGLANNNGDKTQKSKSFMSSLKHLTLPSRKSHRNKNKQRDNSTGSQASSISQLNTSVYLPHSNPGTHSLSAEPVFLSNTTDPTPIRRTRSISQSFKNLFRSSSKKKSLAARQNPMSVSEYANTSHPFIVDDRDFPSTSTPASKKLSFLHRNKSKANNKQKTNVSTNSLSSYDCSRSDSVRNTPVRANVGRPVTMTKSLVR